MAVIVLGDLNNTTPAAPAGRQNVQWQKNGNDISANIPTPLGIATPPASGNYYLANDLAWKQVPIATIT